MANRIRKNHRTNTIYKKEAAVKLCFKAASFFKKNCIY
jgi:hypothetical protein